MQGVYALLARLLYGSGMRLMECVRLRVKDLDFEQREILVRDGKGAKDRVTMLPETLTADLREHLMRRRQIFEDDLRLGKASVYLPYALERKYPAANRTWSWQYVFPSGVTQSIHAADWSAAIISTKSCCNGRGRRR
jgi:integrase